MAEQALRRPADCPLPQGTENVRLDPRDFTTRIDNPWWPMRPGARWTYRETDPEGTKLRVVVTVTKKTKRIANGITARVVHDVVTEDGEPVEVTDDWYAQDRCGNVWYLGEATKEYENGKVVSTEGSFEAGVDGAQPGVIMPAKPRPGLAYRQEHYTGHAEDRAAIVSLREQVEVPYGHFRPGQGPDDEGSEPAAAEDPRVQVLRPRHRSRARSGHLGWSGPRGARPLLEMSAGNGPIGRLIAISSASGTTDTDSRAEGEST